MCLRMYSCNVLSVFHDVIHSPLTGYHLGHSSGLRTLGSVEMERTQLLVSENLQNCKLGVGLGDWGIRREELRPNALVKEDAVATAQGSDPVQS